MMTALSSSFDLIVIGSGPGGYRAAVQSAKLKKRVAVVEMTPGRLGGSWIHTGTIPSKTLRESMEAIHAIRHHAGVPWVERIINAVPAQELFGRAAKVAQAEEAIVRRYFDRYKIEIIHGFATFDDRHTVRILGPEGTRVLQADKILIATGSRPRRPPEIPFDGWRVVDADDILKLEAVPKSLVIYGAGVIGCEYACIFSAMGVQTTIVDRRDTIMQHADREVAAALMKSMGDAGVRFTLGSGPKSVTTGGAVARMTLDNGGVVEAEVVFWAAGRHPNSERLGLERVGVSVNERAEITVNEHFQTSVPNIYAVGDVIGMPALAATAAAQGRHAACHMFTAVTKRFPDVFPVGIYTIPELSSVGASEQQLVAEGADFVIGRAGYGEVARGYIRGDAHGLLKLLVCRRTHKILGIHIAGHDACNLIHIGLAFMQKGGHAQDLVDMIFNYPTLAEAYRIAAFNALNKLFPEGVIGDPPAETPGPPPPATKSGTSVA